MILLDTNIISTFSKLDRFGLLHKVFNKEAFFISPIVFNELKKAKDKKFDFAKNVFELINNKKLVVVMLSKTEKVNLSKLPDSFSAGERDSVAICKERKSIFVTNERKVVNYCKREGIIYFDLRDILKALYEFEYYSRGNVIKLIDEIEEKDNIVIKDREELFR